MPVTYTGLCRSAGKKVLVFFGIIDYFADSLKPDALWPLAIGREQLDPEVPNLRVVPDVLVLEVLALADGANCPAFDESRYRPSMRSAVLAKGDQISHALSRAFLDKRLDLIL